MPEDFNGSTSVDHSFAYPCGDAYSIQRGSMSAQLRGVAVISLCLAVACGDSASRARAVAAVSSITHDAEAVCDSVASESRARSATAIVRSVADTLISEQDNGMAYSNAPEHRACLTAVREEHTRPYPGPRPVDSEGVPLWRAGWTMVGNMMADGPGVPDVIADITAAIKMDAEILGPVAFDWSTRPYLAGSAPR